MSGAIHSPITIERWQWLAFITNEKVQLGKIAIHKCSVVLAEAVVCWSPAAIKLTKAWNYGMYASTSPLVSPRFPCGSKHKGHHTKQWRFNLSFDRQPVFHCESHLCDRTSGFLRNCSICVKFLLFPSAILKIIFIRGGVLKTITPCTAPKRISLVAVEFDEEFNLYFGRCLRSFLGVDKYLVEIVSVCQKTK